MKKEKKGKFILIMNILSDAKQYIFGGFACSNKRMDGSKQYNVL